MPGIVYILTHPAMDGLIKIGCTQNLAERMRTLYNSSVPAPFTCYYAACAEDVEAVERDLHEIFGDRRINPRREFFTADPHRVALALRNHVSWLENVVDTTQQEPEDIDATNKAEEATERLANFDLGTLGIPQGAELTFVDREEITCRVVQLKPPRVEYNGRVGDWRGNGRRMGVAVPGSFRNAGASLPAMAPFPVAALRTGQAALPHPALQWDHAFRTRNTLATAGSR